MSGGAGSLQGIVNYNTANPVEGLKYQQGQLLGALSPDTSALAADTAAGKAANAAVIDTLLADTDVIMVPSGNGLVNIADRAGYPVLTVPAGYGTGGAGRNPIGVTFVGRANSEAALLAAGYAYEQATNVRLAPSFTNPSMFRCVEGSTFFSPHHCHPGDVQSATADGPNETVVAGDVGGSVPATLSLVARHPGGDVRRVHAGRDEGLHGVDDGHRHLDGGRRGAVGLRPRPPDERHVRAAVAAGGLLLQGGLDGPGLQRGRVGPVQAAHRVHRPAADGGVLEDAHVHVEHHDAVAERDRAVGYRPPPDQHRT